MYKKTITHFFYTFKAYYSPLFWRGGGGEAPLKQRVHTALACTLCIYYN